MLEQLTMTGARLRVVIYTRYSSDLQNPRSNVDQERECRARVAPEPWEVIKALSDQAISGGSSFRPGYQELLQLVRSRGCDVILAEALDRLSRDQEDTAALYKRCQFAGIVILTLAEGEIEEWHVGLKGTMGALYLKDLAEKTRRGLRGRIEAGASAGGLSYGYDVVLSDTDRGQRTINPDHAAVVVRICEDYRDGLSPKRIAAGLNAEGVPGPSGGSWSQSTINGNRRRGTGILNNELYVGVLIWNRLTYVKDPDTGKRVSRPNLPNKICDKEVPHLRIISDELSDAVKARQKQLDARSPDGGKATFQMQQRPRYIFSGLIKCGAC